MDNLSTTSTTSLLTKTNKCSKDKFAVVDLSTTGLLRKIKKMPQIKYAYQVSTSPDIGSAIQTTRTPLKWVQFSIKNSKSIRNINTKIKKFSCHYPKENTIKHVESTMLTKNTQILTNSIMNSVIFVKIKKP